MTQVFNGWNYGSVTNKSIIPLAGATSQSLTTSQSGSLFTITGGAGGATYSLPSPSIGLSYDFVLVGLSGASNITVAATSTLLYGYILGSATRVACSGNTNVIFVRTNGAVGDKVSFVSDGTNWYVQGLSQNAGGFSTS